MGAATAALTAPRSRAAARAAGTVAACVARCGIVVWMKAVQQSGPGGPETLQIAEIPRPEPKAGEVLIRVEAAGVNRPDILQRKGMYPPPPGASPILGLEVAGTVETVGPGVTDWNAGDRVCALVAGGGYAEYCVAASGQCLPIPKGVSVEQAAGIPETFFTVWANVFMRGKLKKGETLLVHGGSSGIGTTAIQLGHAFGAKVFATAGSAEKCEACLTLGAIAAINYKQEDFVARVREMNGGKGADVILDMIGGDYFVRNLDLLNPEGRLVQIATQKGEKVELSIRTLMSKGAIVTGSTLRPRSVAQKSEIAKEVFREVWPLFETQKIRVVVDRVFSFSDVAAAHRRMESNEHIGKLVLRF